MLARHVEVRNDERDRPLVVAPQATAEPGQHQALQSRPQLESNNQPCHRSINLK
jgi:hypothetical protein